VSVFMCSCLNNFSRTRKFSQGLASYGVQGILLMLLPSLHRQMLAAARRRLCKVQNTSKYRRSLPQPHDKGLNNYKLDCAISNLYLSVSWEAALPAVNSTNIVVAGLSFCVSKSDCPPRPAGGGVVKSREALAGKTLACSLMAQRQGTPITQRFRAGGG
jgi:hypothetical protein